jgi:hypothetical protein
MLGRVCVLGVVAAVAGCVETTGAGDGLSGTEAQFSQMEQPCIAQAARLTGVSRGAIFVRERIRTGGGPLLVLDAGGAAFSCRFEDDGSVTVFSEFAN